MQSSSSAIGRSRSTFSIAARSESCPASHSYPASAARESSGIPSRYLPVSSPDASGLQIVVPMPRSSYRRAYSRSTRRYKSFSQAVTEVVNARVWGGIHFRTADNQGVKIGRSVYTYMTRHYFKPLK